jgi:glycosyltransferase involved in cell wall biosynthesis
LHLSIIIPVYNEADIITKALDRLRETRLPVFVKDAEVIVVDDCSTDASASLAENYSGGDLCTRVIRMPVNGGKGAAVAAGVRYAHGDTIAVQDADLELDPADLPALLIKYHDEELDIVSGTRFRIRQRHPGYAVAAITVNRYSLC